MATIYAQHFVQFFDDNGDPLAGGKLYAYAAGTTTPKDTYTTAAGGTANANPVILDAAGRATIFLSGSYKFTLHTSADVLVKTTDNVSAFASSISGGVSDITTDYTEAVVAVGDSFVFSDLSDSNTTRRDTVQGILDLVPAVTAAAAQSDQETATSTTTFVSPGRQQYHPSAAKAWVKFTTVTSTAILASYNITSIADNGTGDTTITIATDFSSAHYAYAAMSENDNGIVNGDGNTPAVGALRVVHQGSTNSTPFDGIMSVIMFGDQ
jgi:hypothetical protein